MHIDDPFTKAMLLTIAIMIGCPVVTAIFARHANRDYDNRWYCNTCGEVWTKTAR